MSGNQVFYAPQHPSRGSQMAALLSEILGQYQQQKALKQKSQQDQQDQYANNLHGSVKTYADFAALTPEQQQILKARGFEFRNPGTTSADLIEQKKVADLQGQSTPDSVPVDASGNTSWSALQMDPNGAASLQPTPYDRTARESRVTDYVTGKPLSKDAYSASLTNSLQGTPGLTSANQIDNKQVPTGQESWTNTNVTGPTSKATISHLNAQTGHENAQTRKVNAETSAIGAAQQPSPGAGLTGDDFLKTLSPGEAALIKKIVSYDADPNKIASTRKTKGEQDSERVRWIKLALQYDPTYDPSMFKQRADMRKSFTSGSDSVNTTNINTTIKHLAPLAKSIEALGNRGLPAWNAVANTAETASGDARVTNFNAKKQAVVTELAKVFKGTASPTTTEIEDWSKSLSPNMSPDQFKGALQSFAQLLGGRISAMDEKYKKGMGKSKDFQILSPASRKILSSIGINADEIEGAGGQQQPAGGKDTLGIL